MSSDSSLQENAAPQTELEHSFWSRREKFDARTETAYQREMERMRQRRQRKTCLAAVALYSAFALGDYAMIPDAWQQAWAIRFLLVVPVLLFCTFFTCKPRHPLAREIMLSFMLIAGGVSLPIIAALSSHPNAAHYQTGIVLVVLFGNIVLNMRFRSALMTSVAMMLLHAFMLYPIEAMPPEVRFNNWLFCFAVAAVSLIGNFRMDQDRRRAYLARAREQERNEELSHAVELLAKLSAEDALTRIADRRAFERRLDIEWGRARRDRQPVALILIDIDCFKNYNDHYGHTAGDACLQRIAAVLKTIPQRSADVVARFGGEEFAALLPGVPIDDAAKLAERMRQAVLDLQIPHATSRVAPGVTASFGVAAVVPAGNAQPDELVRAAHGALCQAKEKGRNRVVVQGETDVASAARAVH